MIDLLYEVCCTVIDMKIQVITMLRVWCEFQLMRTG